MSLLVLLVQADEVRIWPFWEGLGLQAGAVVEVELILRIVYVHKVATMFDVAVVYVTRARHLVGSEADGSGDPGHVHHETFAGVEVEALAIVGLREEERRVAVARRVLSHIRLLAHDVGDLRGARILLSLRGPGNRGVVDVVFGMCGTLGRHLAA